MAAATATRAYRLLDSFSGDLTLPLFWANGTPVNGTSGTLAGVAPPGALLITTEVALYQNSNTLLSPTWSSAVVGGSVVITGGTIDGTVIGGSTAAAGKFTTVTASAPMAFAGGGLTAVTSIANQQTATTGGITLAAQALAPGSVWRITAFGTYTAAISATARNAVFAPYWGSSALTAITVAVLASTAQTTGWSLEFDIAASSTTAAWVAGYCSNQLNSATIPTTSPATAASNTGLTAGAQTLDLRFSTSASVSGDSFQVQGVTIVRLT